MKYYMYAILLLVASCKTTKNIGQKPFPKNKVVTIMEDNMFSGLSEPSICINKTDTKSIIAGSIYDNLHISNDGGITWTNTHISSQYGVFGDPCLASDYVGNIYFLHLANTGKGSRNDIGFIDRIVVQKSTDKGKTWVIDAGVGNNPPKKQDKHWVGINPVNNDVAVTWTEFDKYNSKEPVDKSRILFSKSTDGGNNWTKPVKINQFDGDCLDDDNTVEGAVPVFDKQGNIYVAWAYHNKIYFDKSTDGGKTWLSNDIVIADQPEGWAYDIPGVFRANGMPVLDIGKGKYEGTLYVNWSDQRNGTDDTDIFFSKSSDGGQTWTTPKRVNNDKTKTHQFFTWMKVDPVTGYIYIVYYDRSKYNDNQTDVVLSISKDGGEHFESHSISDKAFTPLKTAFFGDYTNIDAYNGVVTPIWTAMENGKMKIKTTTLNFN